MEHVKVLLLGLVLCLGATGVWAGDINPPAGPVHAGSAMNTLEDIYNLINSGTTNEPRTGAFVEPSAGPADSDRHTLTDVYDRAKTSSRPAKTGQTRSYSKGDDGDLGKGVTMPNPRFTNNGNGTVTDNLTGLIWLENANCWGGTNWPTALANCNQLASGSCGLSDGSLAAEWRLPNVKELQSLIDFGYFDPALSNGDGTAKWSPGDSFIGVQSNGYWSSTTGPGDTGNVWGVSLSSGTVGVGSKLGGAYAWPVRGGQ